MELTIGYLLSVIRENNLPDDVRVFYRRIEDVYFDENKWKTLKVKGNSYYKAIHHNEQLDLGKLVNDGHLDSNEVGRYYWHDDYKDKRKYINMNDEILLDNYIEATECFYNKEENILCITAHY